MNECIIEQIIWKRPRLNFSKTIFCDNRLSKGRCTLSVKTPFLACSVTAETRDILTICSRRPPLFYSGFFQQNALESPVIYIVGCFTGGNNIVTMIATLFSSVRFGLSQESRQIINNVSDTADSPVKYKIKACIIGKITSLK